MLTLNEAMRTGKLAEFITQEEKRGIGPADRNKLEALLEKASKSHQSGGRTSLLHLQAESKFANVAIHVLLRDMST